ncbi:hypothetical protein [Achromobacter agilis]|nr:hypothetical protein [Achromobacter agilis]
MNGVSIWAMFGAQTVESATPPGYNFEAGLDLHAPPVDEAKSHAAASSP